MSEAPEKPKCDVCPDRPAVGLFRRPPHLEYLPPPSIVPLCRSCANYHVKRQGFQEVEADS